MFNHHRNGLLIKWTKSIATSSLDDKYEPLFVEWKIWGAYLNTLRISKRWLMWYEILVVKYFIVYYCLLKLYLFLIYNFYYYWLICFIYFNFVWLIWTSLKKCKKVYENYPRKINCFLLLSASSTSFVLINWNWVLI